MSCKKILALFFFILLASFLIISKRMGSARPVQNEARAGSALKHLAKRQPRSFFTSDTLLLFAHRGASAHFPENTLLAFREALSPPHKANVLELDLRLTKDKILIVIHDKSLARTTGLKRNVDELTFAQISTLDAAYNFMPGAEIRSTKNPSQTKNKETVYYPYRGRGIKIPGLRQVFAAFPRTPINMEMKYQEEPQEISEALWALIQEYRRESLSLVVSASQEALIHFRRISQGQTATGASMQEVLRFVTQCYVLSLDCSVNFDALQIPLAKGLRYLGLDLSSHGFIDFAHRHGLMVHYWGVNKRAVMQTLIKNGADGIMSDFF